MEQCPFGTWANAQQCPLHVVVRRTRDPHLYREAGDASKAKPYLPDTQKQYLITRNGACKRPVCVLAISRPFSVMVTWYPVSLQNPTGQTPTGCRLHAAVACRQRAAAVTGAAAAHEKLVEGDAGEQWVEALGPDGSAKQRAAAAAGPDDDIPTLGDDDAAAQKVGLHALEFFSNLLPAARYLTFQSHYMRHSFCCDLG